MTRWRDYAYGIFFPYEGLGRLEAASRQGVLYTLAIYVRRTDPCEFERTLQTRETLRRSSLSKALSFPKRGHE